MDCAARKKINRIKEEEEGEDRISRLPDELIHHVLSFLDDTGLAVQTCVLSTRWKNIWKSLPHLTFKYLFFHHARIKFFKLVNRTISGRYHTCNVSTIRFYSAWSIPPHLFIKILKYSFSHGTQHLYIKERGEGRRKAFLLPVSTFSSQSLKHLTLGLLDKTHLEITIPSPTDQSLEILSGPLRTTSIRATWNLPNLTNLYLFNVKFRLSSHSTVVYDNGRKSVDIFSNLVHLKDLTLVRCAILNVDALNIISVSLKHLHISTYYRQPPCAYVVSTPNITSLKCQCDYPIKFSSTEQLSCLTEATIDLGNYGYFKIPVEQSLELWSHRYTKPVEKFLELLSLARNATFLTISAVAVEVLSGAPELLGNRASPFDNLKCLTVKAITKSAPIAKDVITYFLNSSPNTSIETISSSGRRTRSFLKYC